MKKKMFGFIAVMAMVIGFAMPVSAMGGSIVPPSEEANGGSEIFSPAVDSLALPGESVLVESRSLYGSADTK